LIWLVEKTIINSPTLQPESDRPGLRMNFDIRLKEVRKDVHERESGHINIILF